MVSLFLNFNKSTASGVFSFLFQYLISWSEHKCVSEHLEKNKQKMSSGKKTIKEKQTILLEIMQCLGQDFVLQLQIFYNMGCPPS